MKYTVLWQAKAEQSLANIWLHADERDAVTRAAAGIDSDLEVHPFDVGESRSANERIIFSGPLGLAYSIWPDDLMVRVLRVWRIRRPDR
jgi:hypothetical protein